MLNKDIWWDKYFVWGIALSITATLALAHGPGDDHTHDMFPVSVEKARSTSNSIIALGAPSVTPEVQRTQNLEALLMKLLNNDSQMQTRIQKLEKAVAALDKRQGFIGTAIIPLEYDQHYHDSAGTMLPPTTP